jgi:hypothetical protein
LIGDYCVGRPLPPPQGKSVLRRDRNYKYKSHEAMLLKTPLRDFCDGGMGFDHCFSHQTEKCETEK